MVFMACCLISGSVAWLSGPVSAGPVQAVSVEAITIRPGGDDSARQDLETIAATSTVLSPQQRKSMGQAIFNSGKGRDGRPVTALFGSMQAGTAQDSGLRLEGAAVACQGCHGSDGRGGGESFVQAPDIRWRSLTAAYGARRPGGKPRPAYTRESFRTAISAGLGSDGQRLDPAMPRFDLASDELDALVEHLQYMDFAAEPLMPALVMLLPSSAAPLLGELAKQLRECAMNTVTTRRFELLYYDSEQQAIDALSTRLAGGQLAALFASYTPGWESSLSAFLQQNSLISLMPLLQREPEQAERLLFRLPAARAQVLALLQSAAQRGARLYLPVSQDVPEDRELQQWARSKADELDLPVRAAIDPSEGPHEWLWLRTANGPIVSTDGKSAFAEELAQLHIDRMLVPSTHLAGLPIDQSAEFLKAVEVDVAFPYKTRFSDTAGPVQPLQVWHALGCELLEHLPSLPSSEADIDAWRQQTMNHTAIDMGSWLSVPAQATLAEDSARVSIERLQRRSR